MKVFQGHSGQRDHATSWRMAVEETDLLGCQSSSSGRGSTARLAERAPGTPPHLQLMDLVVELGPGPLPIAALGLQLLQLHLQLLLLVLHLLLGLAQDPQLARQVCVLLLQRLLVLVEVGLGLAEEAEGRGGITAEAGGHRKVGSSAGGESALGPFPSLRWSRDLCTSPQGRGTVGWGTRSHRGDFLDSVFLKLRGCKAGSHGLHATCGHGPFDPLLLFAKISCQRFNKETSHQALDSQLLFKIIERSIA